MSPTENPKCVLLVDDDPISIWLQKEIMRVYTADAGHTHEASNGEEALNFIKQYCEMARQALKEFCPDLIFLDLNMPVMDGFEFLEAFEQLDSTYKKEMRIVVLTSSNNPDDLDKLKSYPIHGFLNKPLTAEKVETLLRA